MEMLGVDRADSCEQYLIEALVRADSWVSGTMFLVWVP